jgi:methionyl-tRNA formyltransferase
LRQFAAQNNVPYFYLTKDRMSEFRRWSHERSPDALVVFSMSQLLPSNVFSFPKYGTINLHPSYLPEYRGPSPDFWQYFDAKSEVGATVHHVNDGEDTGDIIVQERVQIEPGIRSPDWLDRVVGETGSRLLISALSSLEDGTAPRIAQPSTSPTARARRIKNAEHNTIVDWDNWPLERIWHLLRGTETWLNCIPQPSGLFRGQRWRVGAFEHEATFDTPGTIHRDRNGTYVACRDGRIRLSVEFSFFLLALYLARRSK